MIDSKNMTRRNFIGSLFSAVPLSIVGDSLSWKNVTDENRFEDLMVDRYYVLQGGQYKDTGGWGAPYYEMGAELTETFKYWDYCNILDDHFEKIEERGFYLSQSQYFGGKPFCFYEKIPLTKKWLMEFYRRHKNDATADWWNRYDEHMSKIKTWSFGIP